MQLLLRKWAKRLKRTLLFQVKEAYRSALFELNTKHTELEREHERIKANYDHLLRDFVEIRKKIPQQVKQAKKEVANATEGLTTFEVLEFFKNNPGASKKGAQDEFDVSYPTLQSRIEVLIEQGKMEQVGRKIRVKE